MPKIRTMGAGLAGSTARNVSVNSNTGGGNKKQGLSTTTNKRVQFVSNAIKTRSYGENRNVIFCVNQLGGVGAVGGGNGSRMFGTTSDGVKDCITGPYGCEQVVREAYLEAYGREPDKSGLRTYCIAMTKRRWSKDDIIADLVKNGDSLACNTDSESESICGHVIDGSISGATVTQMQNGVNVVIGATNAQGYFDLTLADTSENASPFVATGGTDIATGLPNKLTLKSNGAVISPTTTVSVVIREANTSLTVDEANQLAADYLGITKDQVTSDYVNDLESSNVDVVTSALVSQRASVQIATIIETAAILSEEENNESVLFNGLGNLIAGDATVVVTDATATTDIVNNSSGATINTTTLTNISTIIADVFNDSEIQTSSQVSQLQVEIISQAEDEDFVTTISNDVLDENDTEAIASNIVTGSDEVELPGSNNMPVIVITGNNTVTVELATTYTDAGATATDSSGETITVTTSGTVNINVIGTYSIMYSATDSAGLQAVQLIRTVNVVDTTPPIITVTGDNPATVELGSTYIDAGVTVTDLSEPVTVTSSSNVDVDIVDSYTVTYTAIDSEGVSTQATRTVNVVDTTAPVITVTGDNPVTVELGSTYTDDGATASDLSDPVTVTSSSNVDVDTLGSYTVTYTATDNQGVSAQATRTVNVVDTTAPVITVTGDNPATVELGSTYIDAGVTVTDLSDPVTVTSSSNVDVDIVDSYTVTYTATDNQGVSTQATRTVNVVDTTAPNTQNNVLSANIVVKAGISVTIGSSGDITNNVWLAPADTTTFQTESYIKKAINGEATSINAPNAEGTYYIYVIDQAGNVSQPSTNYVIVDNTAPAIIVTTGTDTILKGGTWTDAGATADSGETVNVSGAVDTSAVGTYTITYTATDSAGNTGEATRTVTVVSWNVSVYGDHGGSSVPDDGIYRTTKIDTSDGGGVGQQWDFVAGTNGVQYEYLFNRNDEDKERVGALSYGNRKIEILFNFVLYSPNDTNTLDSHYININAGKNDDQLAFETDQLAFAYIENSVHGKIYRSTITPPTNNAYVNVWPTTAVANQPTNYYTPDVTYEVTDNKSKIILDFSDFSGIKNQATNGFGLDATDDDKKYYLYINRGFISYGEDGFYPLVPPVTGADYALITLSNY